MKTQTKAWGFKNLACLPCRIPIYRNIQQGLKLEHYESDTEFIDRHYLAKNNRLSLQKKYGNGDPMAIGCETEN